MSSFMSTRVRFSRYFKIFTVLYTTHTFSKKLCKRKCSKLTSNPSCRQATTESSLLHPEVDTKTQKDYF